MSKKRNRLGVFRRLERLYADMEQEYRNTAEQVDFSCAGCPNNCCTTYFQHHTYIEWAYLWKGMETLPEETRQAVLEYSREYVREAKSILMQGERPHLMCPLNRDGLCILYSHRLMICRLHGTAHTLIRPDYTVGKYPGCFRFEEAAKGIHPKPGFDRTPLYRRLAQLEQDFAGPKLQRLPKVDLTLAEMLVNGSPRLG